MERAFGTSPSPFRLSDVSGQRLTMMDKSGSVTRLRTSELISEQKQKSGYDDTQESRCCHNPQEERTVSLQRHRRAIFEARFSRLKCPDSR